MRINTACLLLGLVCAVSSPAIFGVEVIPRKPETAQPEAPKSEVPKAAAFFVPPPPPTADEMRAQVDGILLPNGYRREWGPDAPDGAIGGTIAGPNKFEIHFWLTPARGSRRGPDQPEFSSYAATLKEGKYQWSREHYIGDELVELTLAADNTLAVAYPDRGLNLTCSIKDSAQLAEALVLILSATNRERRLSWDDAKKLLKGEDVRSLTKLHTGTVRIHMVDGTTYTTRQPTGDALDKSLRALGKEMRIPIAVD
jgi:hypothetical protein